MTTALFFFTVALVVLIILGVASSALKPGIGGRVYRNTGTYGSPSWTAQNLVKDVHLAMPWDMVEAGSRETKAKLFMKTRTDITPQVVMRADDADAGYLAFRAAANSPTAVLDLLILDGLISVEGVHGVRAEFIVNLATQPQEIDGSIYDTFDLKPTWTSNGYPGTVIMGSASTPTITTL